MLAGAPPFYSPNRDEMFKNILTKPLSLKPYFSQEVSDLLLKLLENNVSCTQPRRRLSNSEEIKRHAFFRPVNWTRLANRELQPPFRPKTRENSEGHNHPHFMPPQKIPESPSVPMTSLEKEALVFDEFTYTETSAFK